jgi:dCMP deaminase
MTGIIQAIATRSTCDRLNVGCAIVRDARVISTGYNGNVSGATHCSHLLVNKPDSPCDTAVHAEANAIVFAARHGVAVHKADLWTTHQPCLSCAKLIVNAGVWRVWYINEYRLREGLDLLLRSGIEVFRIREDYSAYQVTR